MNSDKRCDMIYHPIQYQFNLIKLLILKTPGIDMMNRTFKYSGIIRSNECNLLYSVVHYIGYV